MSKYADATATGFSDYHEARGREVPGTWDETKINASLLIASEWLDMTFGKTFVGEKTAGFLQEREWPRVNAVTRDPRYSYAVPTDIIPTQIIQAVYEAAYRDAQTPGILLVDYTPDKFKRVSVDGAVAVEYRQFTFASEKQTSIPIIERLISDFLYDDNGSAYSGAIAR
jgi:hypothetical protein